MFLERLKQKLAEPYLVSADDGYKVFFPFGPLRGYVLPRRAFESIIGTFYFWRTVITLGSLLPVTVASKLFDIQWDVLLCATIFCVQIGFYFVTKRITRKLAILPRSMGMRVYARALGPLAMWKQLWFFVMSAAMFGTWAYLSQPSIPLVAATVFCTLCACVSGRAIYLAKP